MSQLELLAFEMPRRPVRFFSQTILPDGLQMNYTKNPNDAVLGASDGDDLVYTSPMGTWFQMDDGSYWYKQETPNLWVEAGAGGGGGTTSPDVMIDMGLFTEDPPRTTIDCGGFE